MSWFELYLEIYRHHHVTPFFLPNPPSPASDTLGSHPGVWLLTVLVCSLLAPLLFAGLLVWRRAHAGDSERGRSAVRFPIAAATTGFGIMLCVLATVNQLIRRPPVVVDLTLRAGNGGFVVLGVVLAFVGMILMRSRTSPARR